MKDKLKSKVIKWFGLFLGFMFIMTFVSRIVYVNNLPKVSVISANIQKLTHVVHSTGSVKAQKNLPIIVPDSLRISEVKVRSGDSITKGQVLLTFDMDYLQELINTKEKEIENQILHNPDAYEENGKKPVYVLENMRIQDICVNKGDQVSIGQKLMVVDVNYLYDHANKLQNEINENIINRDKLYESGDDSSADILNDKINEEQAIADKYWELYSDGGAVYSSFDGVITDVNVQIGSITANSAAILISESPILNYEISDMKNKIEELRDIYDSNGIVCSPCAGTISEVLVMPGNFTTNSAAFVVNDSSEGFIFSSYLNESESKFLSVNDSVTLSFYGGTLKINDGVIKRIVKDGENRRIDIFLDNEELVDGEIGELQFMVSSSESYICVERSAVNIDEKSETEGYIYVLSEVEGFLGKEYIVKRQNVTIKDISNKYYGLESFYLDDSERIVGSSSKKLSEGQKVRVIS
jgi:hypothetical protein